MSLVRHLRRGVGLACLAGGLAATPSGQGHAAGPDTRSLLRDVAGFTDADWAQVERGTAVAKILDSEAREIAVAGAVRIAAPRARLVARLRDVDNLKRSAVVLDVGRFGRPPTAGDLASASLEPYDLDLRDCRPGDCRVRLAAAEIERFHRDVNWRAADWRARSAAVWRDVLAGYAGRYAQGGRSALPVYANKAEALSVAAESADLARGFGFVARYSPELHAYLHELGPALPPGTEDTIYWSKEDFGVRPVFRISHQIVSPGGSAVLVATSQVYADHYMDAALGVTLAIDAAPDGKALYMVAINRARTRSLTGMLRRMVRGTVQGRSRDAMRKILTATRTALEAR